MNITDKIADMLTRIRNAAAANHPTVDIPASKLKINIAQILVNEGYIKSFETVKGEVEDQIRVTLKYVGRQPAITGIKRISKPGLRIYSNAADMPKVLDGLGIAIVSTSNGIMTDKTARQQKVGGEVLAYVW
ncbi:MAG: 30S ribosomal protein S8 [Clostridiaceae bacterium]|nr:30S ribosomal protein S8 [Clostridiaceae bacterium]